MACNERWTLFDLHERLGASWTRKHWSNIVKKSELRLVHDASKKLTPAVFVQREIDAVQQQKDALVSELARLHNRTRLVKRAIMGKNIRIRAMMHERDDLKSRPVGVGSPCAVPNCPGTLAGDVCAACDAKHCLQCGQLDQDQGGGGGGGGSSSDAGSDAGSTGSDVGNHVCDPDILASVQYLTRITKPCPGCNVMTQKARDTCSQMWCNRCHTTWDWDTGGLSDEQVLHNPEFNEFVAAGARPVTLRADGDETCGGLPRVNLVRIVFSHIAQRYRSIAGPMHAFMGAMYKAVKLGHRLQTSVVGLRRHLRDANPLQDLPWELAIGKIDEDAAAAAVWLAARRRECAWQQLPVLETVLDLITEYSSGTLRLIYDDGLPIAQLLQGTLELQQNLIEVVPQANQQLQHIQNTLGVSGAPCIEWKPNDLPLLMTHPDGSTVVQMAYDEHVHVVPAANVVMGME